MTILMQLGELASRAARIASTGVNGVRTFTINALRQEHNGGTVISFYDGLSKFGKSLLFQILQFAAYQLIFSFSAIWSLVISASQFILHFNWNSTDAQLEEQIKAANIALAAAKGRLAGQSLGYLICGVTPTATLAVFNEPMALHVLHELGEDAAAEIAGALSHLILLQSQQAVKSAFAQLFKNYRTLLRPIAIGFAQELVNLGILTQDSVDKANKKKDEPWTIAGALQESIDSIKNPIDRTQAQSFWDELGAMCIHAGYVVSGSIDNYFAQQKIGNDHYNGDEKIIEINPDRGYDLDAEVIG